MLIMSSLALCLITNSMSITSADECTVTDISGSLTRGREREINEIEKGL